MDLSFATEVKLGVTKGTALEQAVKDNFSGENWEVGWYLAAARQAQREGYPEVGEVLIRIAWEEAMHAARFGELNGEISASTKENIEKALAGEQKSNQMKREAAVKAKQDNIDEAHDFFDEAAKDEARHARALKGLLDRYFK
ncbi:ferritin-like domain-containing protein [Desulfoscipio geothermicus]|uniref:Rubrerythrin n=1 Tax=Desulfoscipio geothermicus DSM 3669 TaxID=1121426 RepID=A0A1I6DSM0_9FIRM|nr:ferritin family protein [Desulfoscipio geothermicus]SFR08328.1 Rubrerythrin [Desulfoscipio geothermicus DSM 3669]